MEHRRGPRSCIQLGLRLTNIAVSRKKIVIANRSARSWTSALSDSLHPRSLLGVRCAACSAYQIRPRFFAKGIFDRDFLDPSSLLVSSSFLVCSTRFSSMRWLFGLGLGLGLRPECYLPFVFVLGMLSGGDHSSEGPTEEPAHGIFAFVSGIFREGIGTEMGPCEVCMDRKHHLLQLSFGRMSEHPSSVPSFSTLKISCLLHSISPFSSSPRDPWPDVPTSSLVHRIQSRT